MNLTFRQLTFALSFITGTVSLPAHSIVTRTCPDQIKVEFDRPRIEAPYAQEIYHQYFEATGPASGELELISTDHSICTYQRIKGTKSPIYRALLRGTFNEGSQNPATMVTYMVLPMRGLSEFDIGDAIVFSPLKKVSRQGIRLKGKTSELFYQSADCEDGPCVVHYNPLGTFKESYAE